MDCRELKLYDALKCNIPKNNKEIIFFWLWLHSFFTSKYNKWKKPYRSGYLTINEVSKGHYIGFLSGLISSLAIWVLLIIMISCFAYYFYN